MSSTARQLALDEMFPMSGGNSGTRSARVRALAAFESHGFPTRRLEEWRYTDLTTLEKAAFQYTTASPNDASIAAARAAIAALPYPDATPLAVFVDGELIPALSRLPATIAETMRSTVGGTNGDAVMAITEPRHALAELNRALARPMAIRIGADFDASGPLVMVFVAATPALATQVQLKIELASGAVARIVQHFIGTNDDAPGWTNVVCDIELAESAQLDLLRVQELGPHQSLTTLIRPRLPANASLSAGSVDIGGQLVRSDVEVALCGSGSRVDLFGLATAIAGQHIDNHVCADHLSPASLSTQTYRSIVDDGGRIVFNGKVIVRPDSQGIDAHQRSDNLLLSRNGEIDTKPELEIYADDVRCSHGATIGELDENELFYLRSRGIPADAARRLLTFAFANRILTRISNPELRGYLATRISGVLTDALPMLDELIAPAGEDA